MESHRRDGQAPPSLLGSLREGLSQACDRGNVPVEGLVEQLCILPRVRRASCAARAVVSG